MEIYESENKKIAVIVDYAHNKLSFETIISSMKKEYKDRPVSILFGCPGNKALVRRKGMAEVSGEMADFVYITEDDPAEERIEDICNEIAGYIESIGGKDKYKIIYDRETAIKTAIEDVKDTAVVILAGKGAEKHQKRGLVSEDYASDAVLAKKYLKEYDERQEK
jgi:UDP-N-acetylmuramoyl-L-alanyl-D-glutamate--2,6-diaminopimelate ligase